MSGDQVARTNTRQPRWQPAIVVVVGALGFLLSPCIATAQKSSQDNPERTAKFQAVAVDSVRIEGGAELTADERAALAESLSGETAHSDWLERLNAEATRRLQNDGFVHGTAAARMESSSDRDHKAHVTVLLTLTSGPRFQIGHVWWAG